MGTPKAGSGLPRAPGLPSARPYLGLHQPAGDRGLPVVAWPELQGHGAGANVGNAQVGGGPREFWTRKTGRERRWPEKDFLLHGPGSWHRGHWVALFLETWVASPHQHSPGLCTTAHSIHTGGSEMGLGAERSPQGQREAPRARGQWLGTQGLPLLGSRCAQGAHEAVGGHAQYAGLRKEPTQSALLSTQAP